jgi:DHA2 family multidrug resistance protein
MNMATPVDDPNKTYKWWLLLIVMIGTFMAVMDSSIVNVSIPTMMADFGVNLDDIEWVMTGYMLAFAVLMPATGWLRIHLGYKRTFLYSLVLFTVGSVLCGLAWNLPSLIVARVLQALGGGAISPTGMGMISEVFPPKERGKAMGYWGMGIIMGPTIGPTLGGYLTHTFGWRSIFLVNIPVGIIAVLMGIEILRSDKPEGKQSMDFDFWGFFSLSLFLVAFLLGLSKGESKGWDSDYIFWCTILSAVGLTVFLLAESLVKEPIINLRIFRHGVFTVTMLLGLVRSIALFGGIFLLPVFLQTLMGFNEIQSGLIMLPGALVVSLVMPISGRISDSIGPRIPTVVGMLLPTYFMWAYRNLDPSMSQWDIIAPTLIRGVGMGLLMAPMTAAAMNAVEQREIPMASSLMNIIMQVGGSVGIALLATIFNHRVNYHLDVLGSGFVTSNPAYAASTPQLINYAKGLGLGHLDSQAFAQASFSKFMIRSVLTHGYQDAFLFGGLICIIGVLMGFLLPGKPLHHPPEGSGVIE